MENNSKYYTPSIEEFHVGFEYEYLSTIKERIYPKVDLIVNGKNVSKPKYKVTSTWENQIFDGYQSLNKDSFADEYGVWYDSIEDNIFLNKIRVKHLDSQDIESLGFLKGSVWYIHEIGVRLAISKSDEMYIKIEKLDTDSHWNLVFNGIIKNKSELKQVLKMIGVEYEK